MTTKGTKVRLFTCQRHKGELRVSKAFCGQSWQRAQTTKDESERERLRPCVGCRVGKRHAQGVPTPTSLPRWAMWSIK